MITRSPKRMEETAKALGTPRRCSQNRGGEQIMAINTANRKGMTMAVAARMPATTMINAAVVIRMADRLDIFPFMGTAFLSRFWTELPPEIVPGFQLELGAPADPRLRRCEALPGFLRGTTRACWLGPRSPVLLVPLKPTGREPSSGEGFTPATKMWDLRPEGTLKGLDL